MRNYESVSRGEIGVQPCREYTGLNINQVVVRVLQYQSIAWCGSSG